jgi:glycerophosphoryl diester phosphodiesterase
MTSLPPWPYPAHIAHRGGGRLAPENTLAAARAGHAHGFRMIEFDVKLSADGVAVLMHDDDVDRTTSGRGPARDKTYAELAQLDAGSWHCPEYAGEPVPAFAAVARYAIANGIACNVEIKPCPGREAETGRAVARLAEGLWAGRLPAPLLSSFSETALAAAQAAAPALPRGLLVDGIAPDWREKLKKYGCVSLNVGQKDISEDLTRAVHGAGYRIAVWTVNSPDLARLMLSWGVDAIFTDELASIRPDA